MSDELRVQQRYWNDEANAFQRIYTHHKSGLSVWLDKIFRKDMYLRYEYTLKHCEPIEGRTFLDVGCGNGLYSIELAKRGARKVVGLDISENMLKLCRQSAQQQGVADRCSFVHGDLLDYQPDEQFDVTFGIGLFDYIRDAAPVLRKMREVTRDKVIASFPRFWTWRAPVRKIRLGVRGCPVYFYTESGLLSMMKDAGFSETEIEKVVKLHCLVGKC
ncbi:MAG TPA: class I SAM-dependent methyltransferase [Planctomycetota bacterium]|nr:class I SAM-dependent methyltransferase [Planctomycetota bacterium]